jgi:diguanylate cyclase (GGDEF)-like protein
MLVRFWGTRGSIPAPGPRTARYGGNTSCVEVRSSDGTLIILDCGTGIRQLGLEILKQRARRIHLLIGHTHWDHIHGFPFFVPASLADCELNIFAPAGFQRSLEDALAGQMQYSYFPVKLQDLPSRIHFTELEEGLFRIGSMLVETQYLNHTAPTIAYRISDSNSTLVYVTDHEPFWNPLGAVHRHPGDQRHIEFLKKADLVIHDAQYTEEEYRTKHGWGHSTIDYATDVAVAAGVAKLALFHHDPSHDDDMVVELERYARARAAAGGAVLEVFAAAEGQVLNLEGTGAERKPAGESALERRPITGGRILVVSSDASEIADVEKALSDDDLVLSSATNGQLAIQKAVEVAPDLVILASTLSDGDGVAFVQPIREAAGKPELPILVFTRDRDSREILYSADQAATDYLPQPYSPPMLRSRVRVWLSRTMNSVALAVNTGPTIPVQAHFSPVALTPLQIAASVDLFRSLATHQLETLLARSSQRTFPPGYAVLQQGERQHNVHILLSGRVRVSESLADNSGEVYLCELHQGEVFGELGPLRDRTREAAVITLERTNCLVIPEADFVEALHASPEMALGIARVLARRLQEADRTLARYAPDPLTGLPGRRAFHDLYKRLSAGARRRGSSVVLIAVDVVRLRGINDLYGYNAGDDVLRAVADILVQSSRATDLVARYGSDEFAALLVEAGEGHVETFVRRIQERFNAVILQRGLPSEAELRIGFAVAQKPPDVIEELLRAADFSLHTHR